MDISGTKLPIAAISNEIGIGQLLVVLQGKHETVVSLLDSQKQFMESQFTRIHSRIESVVKELSPHSKSTIPGV
eukprot:IDg3596t1